MAQDVLIEIGTEELPPKSLRLLALDFREQVRNALSEQELWIQCETNPKPVKWFATPRRLALIFSDVPEKAPEKEIAVWGPPTAIAFDNDGKPTKAALAFANKNGIDPASLQVENDGKVDKLVFRSFQLGKTTAELLPGIVDKALANLPIPKRMRWGASRVEFVRPLQWVVLMQGPQVLDAEILGFKAGNLSRGHRFHCDTYLEIANPSAYEKLLENSGHVIPSFKKRREMIRQQVTAEGKKLGGIAVIDDDLLNEVTALVEWPVALTGSFEERFLAVPAEALISSMKEHQKYFHVTDNNGKLMPNFITVANLDSEDPAQVIRGNEKVIRPRLSDAAFFFETDKKIPLAQRVEKLKTVVFQEKLGTLYEKVQRVQKLAKVIAPMIGGNPGLAERAGALCKADLVSDMVLEFGDMQGIAGRYYALAEGEDSDVANAIRDHYLPKFAGDELPKSTIGCAVALADRLDTIVGIFGIGQKPTGSKDPFAIRRASISVLRILVDKGYDIDLRELLKFAALNYGPKLNDVKSIVNDAFDYMIERFRAGYVDEQIPVEVFMAVSAKNISQPLDIDQRVKAVHSFSQLSQAQALAAANKRVSNILAKLEDQSAIGKVDNALLKEPAEQALAKLLTEKQAIVAPLFAGRCYKDALAKLADLREPVDTFFDDVMVMVDDAALRNNRLALLKQLRDLFLEVADISQLAPTK